MTVTVLVLMVFQPALVYCRRGCTDGYKKAGLYDHILSLVVDSIFYKSWERKYEALLIHFPNNCVYERGRVGETAWPRLQVGVQLCPLDHCRFRDISKSIKSLLLLRSREVSLQLNGIHKCSFNDCRDRIMKTISDLPLFFRVEEVTMKHPVDVHEMALVDSIRLVPVLAGLL